VGDRRVRGPAELPGFEERIVDVRAVRMRALVGGEGPPLVLVHGLTGAATNFAELAPLLARRFRVVVPELPGHGGSAPLPAAPNLDAFAERVRGVAAAERMLPASFVGHSLGALVSLRLAMRRPEDVRSLVLAGAAGIASATRWAEFWLTFFGRLQLGRKIAPHRGLLARRPRLRYLAFGYWGASDPGALSARQVDGFLAGPERHSDTWSAMQVLVRDDPRLDLERVRCPVLVLWGARDRQVPIDDAFEYARRLRAQLRTIADCGHLLVGERPHACAHAIAEFVAPLDGVRKLDELPLEVEPLR
jgi:magnesium chelatase accessory protein